MDDATLYRRWLERRDAEAFAALARKHADLVVDVAWRVRRDEAAAEDALQEALLALAKDGTERPAVVGVRAWLARAAITRALHARESEAARKRREREVGARRGSTTMDESREAQETVEAALARVDGRDAAILTMRFLHGFEYREIAAVLDVEESTARVQVHRAVGRVREEARREDLEESALASALAAAPARSVSAKRVATAVDHALAGAKAGAGAAVVGAAASGRVVAFVALALLATGGGVVAWHLADRTPSSPAPNARPDEARAPEDGPALSARPAEAPGVRSTPSTDPKAAAGKVPPGPPRALRADGRTTAVPASALVLVVPRMELVHANGEVEELSISEYGARGEVWDDDVSLDADPGLRVYPGHVVHLGTDDPRAAIPTVTVVVPDPVPAVLVARVPEKGDPRLDQIVLVVVDAKSGEPLPDAVLEWGDPVASPARQPADAQGRIVVRSRREGDLPLFRLQSAEKYVHAPGHRGYGRAASPGPGKEFVPSLDAAEMAEWLSHGTLRIALEPDDEPYEERTICVLDADGSPAAGAYLFATYAVPGTILDLGQVLPEIWSFGGFRIADGDGLVEVALLRDFVALEHRVDGVPVAAWGLAGSTWPATGPRTLRLPPIARLELTVAGLPPGERGWWTMDDLGPKRTLKDGPAFPPTVDPAAEPLLAERKAVIPVVLGLPWGELVPPSATIRLPVTVGRTLEVHLRRGEEERVWEVRADAPGPLRLSRRWDDLPLASD